MGLGRCSPEFGRGLTQVVGSNYRHAWGRWRDARLSLNQPGLAHRLPESVARMGEMYTHRRGPEAGINSHDEEATALPNEVGNAEALELSEVSLVERHDGVCNLSRRGRETNSDSR